MLVARRPPCLSAIVSHKESVLNFMKKLIIISLLIGSGAFAFGQGVML
jgi:hypothetical protein